MSDRLQTEKTRLVALYLNARQPVRELTQPIVLFGRDVDCDVVLASQSVDAAHAALVRTSCGWWICSLVGARQPTINGEACGRRRLQHGDEIGIGAFLFRFECSADEFSESGRTVAMVDTSDGHVHVASPPIVRIGGGSAAELSDNDDLHDRVACLVALTSSGLIVRRTTPAVPVNVNGQWVRQCQATAGDHVAVGSAKWRLELHGNNSDRHEKRVDRTVASPQDEQYVVTANLTAAQQDESITPDDLHRAAALLNAAGHSAAVRPDRQRIERSLVAGTLGLKGGFAPRILNTGSSGVVETATDDVTLPPQKSVDAETAGAADEADECESGARSPWSVETVTTPVHVDHLTNRDAAGTVEVLERRVGSTFAVPDSENVDSLDPIPDPVIQRRQQADCDVESSVSVASATPPVMPGVVSAGPAKESAAQPTAESADAPATTRKSPLQREQRIVDQMQSDLEQLQAELERRRNELAEDQRRLEQFRDTVVAREEALTVRTRDLERAAAAIRVDQLELERRHTEFNNLLETHGVAAAAERYAAMKVADIVEPTAIRPGVTRGVIVTTVLVVLAAAAVGFWLPRQGQWVVAEIAVSGNEGNGLLALHAHQSAISDPEFLRLIADNAGLSEDFFAQLVAGDQFSVRPDRAGGVLQVRAQVPSDRTEEAQRCISQLVEHYQERHQWRRAAAPTDDELAQTELDLGDLDAEITSRTETLASLEREIERDTVDEELRRFSGQRAEAVTALQRAEEAVVNATRDWSRAKNETENDAAASISTAEVDARISQDAMAETDRAELAAQAKTIIAELLSAEKSAVEPLKALPSKLEEAARQIDLTVRDVAEPELAETLERVRRSMAEYRDTMSGFERDWRDAMAAVHAWRPGDDATALLAVQQRLMEAMTSFAAAARERMESIHSDLERISGGDDPSRRAVLQSALHRAVRPAQNGHRELLFAISGVNRSTNRRLDSAAATVAGMMRRLDDRRTYIRTQLAEEARVNWRQRHEARVQAANTAYLASLDERERQFLAVRRMDDRKNELDARVSRLREKERMMAEHRAKLDELRFQRSGMIHKRDEIAGQLHSPLIASEVVSHKAEVRDTPLSDRFTAALTGAGLAALLCLVLLFVSSLSSGAPRVAVGSS